MMKAQRTYPYNLKPLHQRLFDTCPHPGGGPDVYKPLLKMRSQNTFYTEYGKRNKRFKSYEIMKLIYCLRIRSLRTWSQYSEMYVFMYVPSLM